jgi:hypothetical protein
MPARPCFDGGTVSAGTWLPSYRYQITEMVLEECLGICGVESGIAPIQNIAWVDSKYETGSKAREECDLHRGKESGEMIQFKQGSGLIISLTSASFAAL